MRPMSILYTSERDAALSLFFFKKLELYGITCSIVQKNNELKSDIRYL